MDTTEIKLITLGNNFELIKDVIGKFIKEPNKDYKLIKIDDQDVKVTLYHTAGQEKYDSIASNYFRSIDAAIVIFDNSDP